MISQQTTLFRINKMGKPYVQSEDPSIKNSLSVNDIWLNPQEGSMKIWNGTGWSNVQFGESAIMDDCITNRMLANDISASKITAGRLQSQNGDFYLDLESGVAELLNLILGGQVEGNIIATSSNGLTRIRLRGREGDSDVTAGIILEERDNTDVTQWENVGQIYFSYNARQSYAAIQNYEIGPYNASRPSQGYNAGETDGLMFRPLSTDWLRAAYATYHGFRLASRADRSSSFEDVEPVLAVFGNCMTGSAVACSGTVTCTYQMNEIMRLDFSLKITTAGITSGTYGISPQLLRQLNANVPALTPISGGTLQMINSDGTTNTTYIGTTMAASSGLWKPARFNNGGFSGLNENVMASGMTLIGTCYGKYNLGED